MQIERNWAGNYAYRAERIHMPGSLDEVASIVASARRLRVLGSRHSFTDIADSTELLSLAELPADVVIDRDASTVSFSAGLTYGQLAGALNEAGLALANLASLPHISVAGAVATATHGSGDANRNLASAVAALELVTSAGERIEVARGAPDFDGFVVGLGALGAVTRLTLDVEPAYEVRQRVFEGLAWDALAEHFDEITGEWLQREPVHALGRGDRLRLDQEPRDDAAEALRESSSGRAPPPSTNTRSPASTRSTCTPQLGRAGPWSDRLPHFRMGFTPSSGDEIQSEYFVAARARAGGDRGRPRASAPACARCCR